MIRSETGYLAPTLKETPNDAEVISHQLMLRAGLIRKTSSGLYSYLPLCLRVLRKVEAIIREEMDLRHGQELLMPILQPAELWQQSGRWDTMGPEMLRLKNREERSFVLGPTHEELITSLVASEIRSYRQLPCTFYQIQTKIRDEVRPRFGVMRAKEFIMKDAYSFHTEDDSLDATYQQMYQAYHDIFKRLNLKAVAVQADAGAMGGSGSAEFMVLAESGEDSVVFCDTCDYGANIEKASSLKVYEEVEAGEMTKVSTPGQKSIEDVSQFLKFEASQAIKTLFYVADEKLVCVLLRGHDQINEVKLKNYLKAVDLDLAPEAIVEQKLETKIGYAGPVGLSGVRIVADSHVASIKDGVTGANEADYHLTHVSYGRDFTVKEHIDLILVQEDECCAECKKGTLKIKRGIEVGHIFKLGTKYTKALSAKFLNENGQEKVMTMGCYGIGVSRTVAAIIEQHHDESGIVWPTVVAPFDMTVVPVNTDDEESCAQAKELYVELKKLGFDVILDDRKERPGFKFKDSDLLGFPLRIVVSKKLCEKKQIEIKIRRTGEVLFVAYETALDEIQKIYNNLKQMEGDGHGK